MGHALDIAEENYERLTNDILTPENLGDLAMPRAIVEPELATVWPQARQLVEAQLTDYEAAKEAWSNAWKTARASGNYSKRLLWYSVMALLLTLILVAVALTFRPSILTSPAAVISYALLFATSAVAFLLWRFRGLPAYRRASDLLDTARSKRSEMENSLYIDFIAEASRQLKVIADKHRNDDITSTFQGVRSNHLVEQELHTYMVSRDLEGRLRRFISSHDTGSVGVVGPKGIGKTTVLRRICDNPSQMDAGATSGGHEALAVYIPAPVKYESEGFISYVTQRICETLADRIDEAPLEKWSSSWIFEVAFALALGGAATALLVALSFPADASSRTAIQIAVAIATIWLATGLYATHPIEFLTTHVPDPRKSEEHTPLDAWSLRRHERSLLFMGLLFPLSLPILYYLYIGVLSSPVFPRDHFMAIGLYLATLCLGLIPYVLRSMKARRSWWRHLLTPDPSRRKRAKTILAERYLRRLRYQEGLSETREGFLRTPWGLGGKLSKQRRLDERTRPLPELVNMFRQLVTNLTSAFVVRGGSARGMSSESREQLGVSYIIIAVDELDRIEDSESVAQFISDLKSLFRVKGCFFLLAMAEDALYSVYGTSTLGAEDDAGASFKAVLDDVEWVDPWTIEEATTLLNSRAWKMPRLAKWLCFACSGGIPRDTIRVARRLIDLAERRHQEQFADLVDPFIRDEMRRVAYWASAELQSSRARDTIAAIADFSQSLMQPFDGELSAFVASLPRKLCKASSSTYPLIETLVGQLYILSTLKDIMDFAIADIVSPDLDSWRPYMAGLGTARLQARVDPERAWRSVNSVRQQLALPRFPFYACDDWRMASAYL